MIVNASILHLRDSSGLVPNRGCLKISLDRGVNVIFDLMTAALHRICTPPLNTDQYSVFPRVRLALRHTLKSKSSTSVLSFLFAGRQLGGRAEYSLRAASTWNFFNLLLEQSTRLTQRPPPKTGLVPPAETARRHFYF